jgi:hypothetical protein
MAAVNKEKIKKSNRNYFILIAILVVCILVLLFVYKSSKKELPVEKDTTEIAKKPKMAKPGDTSSLKTTAVIGEKIDFLNPMPIGKPFIDTPMISNLAVTDLDGDGLQDIIVCDVKNNTVSWMRQYPLGKYTEIIITKDLIAPAHVQVYDVDKDGDKDLVIAVLGFLFPNNEKIGSVVVLENVGSNHFKEHVVAEKIARVSDVRAGDLDGDGDLDFAVAQFGYSDGETRWIENLGNWKFESHILQNLSGPINVILSDVDNDGDLDIISLVSQEWEEIYCFINDGKGHFKPKLVWGSNNEDFGSSNIFVCDLDKDGDDDILYTNGDSFNYSSPTERPWHGVQWLENKGNANFAFHRICDFPGAYNVRPTDIDHDGDIDLFVVSAFNKWEKPEAQSFIWLENTGNMQFIKRNIANKPTHLITLEMGDFNNDGLMDMVTGCLHVSPPYDRMGRVTLWMNNGALSKKK